MLRFWRIFKPRPRKAFDVSNYWLNYTPTYDQALVLMQTAKDLGYTVAMVGCLKPEIANLQIKAALSVGLLVDVYMWVYFDEDYATNLQRVWDSITGTDFTGLLWLDFEETPPANFATQAYVAGLVGYAWDQHFRPAIYTRRGWWVYEMSNSDAFAYLALWDADPDSVANAKLSGALPWAPYGGWAKRVWKQYAWNQNLDGMNVDLNTEWV